MSFGGGNGGYQGGRTKMASDEYPVVYIQIILSCSNPFLLSMNK
jgi:hypothetical protein